MTAPLAGRDAIVTGGSRGIGRGCAIELGVAGATVYITGQGPTDTHYVETAHHPSHP